MITPVFNVVPPELNLQAALQTEVRDASLAVIYTLYVENFSTAIVERGVKFFGFAQL